MSGHPDGPARRGFRFPAGVEAVVHDPNGTFVCAAENLSRSGVLLVGSLPPPSQEQLDITLKDRSGRHEARLAGRVIRASSEANSNELRLAVEFVALDDADRDALEVLLARVIEAGAPPNALDGLRPGASSLEIRKALESIPLPQRLSLAGRAGSKEREYLRQDTSAAVLDALAKNPGLTLAEARILASSPFLASGVIDQLAVDTRFAADEELIIALAAHPRVSVPTADRLTSQLKPAQLRRLLSKPGLRGALREKLLKKLATG